MKATKISRIITVLNDAQLPASPDSHISDIDPRALITITTVYLIALLSVPLSSPGMLIWFAAYPIITAPLAHITYEKVFVRSLIVTPVIIAIAIFNPICDTTPALKAGPLSVSSGWISFFSLLLRGLLSVQALLLLIHIAGFNRICEGLRGLHFPPLLVTQLLLAYRYMSVLLEEVQTMHIARLSRGFGRDSYPPSMWGPFIGQLLIRSMERSRRIFTAMQARGFTGTLTVTHPNRWNVADTLYCIIWLAVIAVMRLTDLSAILLKLIQHS